MIPSQSYGGNNWWVQCKSQVQHCTFKSYVKRCT